MCAQRCAAHVLRLVDRFSIKKDGDAMLKELVCAFFQFLVQTVLNAMLPPAVVPKVEINPNSSSDVAIGGKARVDVPGVSFSIDVPNVAVGKGPTPQEVWEKIYNFLQWISPIIGFILLLAVVGAYHVISCCLFGHH